VRQVEDEESRRVRRNRDRFRSDIGLAPVTEQLIPDVAVWDRSGGGSAIYFGSRARSENYLLVKRFRRFRDNHKHGPQALQRRVIARLPRVSPRRTFSIGSRATMNVVIGIRSRRQATASSSVLFTIRGSSPTEFL
jgi:hypothetical protein